MSVLLIGAEGDVGESVVTRLVEQGDEVRVIEPDPGAAGGWRSLGAYVAAGSPDDADLVERAAQDVRTIVVLSDVELDAVIRGARAARVGRLVVCTASGERHDLDASDVEYVVLIVPKARFGRRTAVSPAALAEAIDAADDLAGRPRMLVDLGDASGWARLGLDAPG